MACKCTVSDAKCTSEDIPCPDGKDCSKPDLSKAACELGGGDCAGYCECEYSTANKGCTLKKAAPANMACKCTADTVKSTCISETVLCKEGKAEDAACKLPDLTKAACELAADGDCGGYCDCAYSEDPAGCFLIKVAPANKACKCTLVADKKTCTSETVDCKEADKATAACTTPDLSDVACALAEGGDCAGHCACGYSISSKYSGAAAAGCFITKKAPAGKSCVCKAATDKCAAFIEDCPSGKTEETLCKTPDTSSASCEFAGGDCAGYCACAYSANPAGCFLTAPAKDTKACKCVKIGTDCKGEELGSPCDKPEDAVCLKPDISDVACAKGTGGDCDGHCECEFVKDKGCKIKATKKAPENKACKCIKGTSTCTAWVVDCLDPKDPKCTTPDDTADACKQGLGDCAGY